VVVVPPEQVERSPRPGAGEPSPGQVVVASDGSELSAAAVRFAFQAAARRRSDLIVICAWTPPFAGYQRIVLGLHQLVRAELHAVYETLTPHRLEFPEVEVEVKLVRRKDSHHGRALVAESATAALIVLGSQERRSLAGWFSDGFVPSVLEHARCPVAVVGAAMTASPTLAPDAANPELLHVSAAPSIDVGRGDVNEVLRWLDST
jgi:nucleotide-binding universal stress UspA family protein